MSIEYKTGTAFLKGLDDKGSGVAVIATLTPSGASPVVDRDGDVTLPGAFGAPVVPFLLSHQWSQVPAGKAWIREEGNEARAYFQLNLATSLGKDLYEAMRFDLSHPPAKMEMSYGFSIPPGGSEFQTLDSQRVRVLKHLQVHEVSSVILGAGIGTRLVAVKDADEVAPLVREHERLQGLKLPELVEPTRSHAFRYKFVSLPPEDPRWQAACVGLKVAVAELRSTEPYLYFFSEARPGDEVSFISPHPLVGASQIPAHPDVVAVHEKLSPAAVLETVGHEVAHFARPGLSEEKVEVFGREIARTGDLRPAAVLVPMPMFVSSDEARELRKHQPVHYSPLLNLEYVLAPRFITTQSVQSKAGMAETAFDRLSPLSGRPIPN